MTNKTAIVTGGGSGLGEAIAKALAGKGVKVVLADINLKGAERVAREIEASGGTASTIQQDMARPEDTEKVVNHALNTYGAFTMPSTTPALAGRGAGWRDRSRGLGARDQHQPQWRALWHALSDPGDAQDRGHECAIVNMASIHGTVAAIGNGAYTAAKHGVVGLTKNAAAEYGPQGLRINCVGPRISRPRCSRPFPPMSRWR